VRSGPVQKLVFEERRVLKDVFSCIFLVRLPRKRNFLAVQGEYDKIIDVVRGKLYIVSD